jgi:glucose dehydrogenase
MSAAQAQAYATSSDPAVHNVRDANATADADAWAGWGGSILNDRWSSTAQVSSVNIKSLALKCSIDFPSGVSAPATLHKGIAYFAAWNGSVAALDYAACQVKWQINATDIIYRFNPNLTAGQLASTSQVARTSPQIDAANGVLFFGTQTWALLVAADLKTGAVLATTQVNPHEFAVVTISPTFYNGTIYVGASSDEEQVAALADPTYQCCSFIGNAAAFTFDKTTNTFTTKWNTSMIPVEANANATDSTGRWSGNGVWGSQPAIDEARSQVFYATGNLYTLPDAYFSCGVQNLTYANATCDVPGVYSESVLALDLETGSPKWHRQLSPLDAWTLACGVPGSFPGNTTLCPQTNPGTDADFGMAPALVLGSKRGMPGKDVVTLGQKNGNLYALAAEDGSVAWASMVTPGSEGGGLSWGVAVDDAAVYFTGINYASKDWTLLPSGQVINSSGFGAVNLTTGQTMWAAAVPAGQTTQIYPTVVGDLVLTGWTSPSVSGGLFNISTPYVGGLLALDKKTGETLLSYPLNGTFYGGIAVSGNYLMLGTGYNHGFVPGSFLVFAVGA